MVTTQVVRGQHSKQVTEIEVNDKYDEHNFVKTLLGTITAESQGGTFTENGKMNSGWKALRHLTHRPCHLTPAMKAGQQPHLG
jgi:hypothetical protein